MTPQRTAAGEPAPLRRRILDAARRLSDGAGGLTLNLDTLTIDEIMQEAGVARTSLYRVWESKEAFYLDLLCDLASPEVQGTVFAREVLVDIRTTVAQNLDQLRDPESRAALLDTVIRDVIRAYCAEVLGSPRWRSLIAIQATVATMENEDEREQVLEQLSATISSHNKALADTIEDVSIVLGLRLRRPGATFLELVRIAAPLIDGMGLRAPLSDHPVTTVVELDGVEWPLPALGFKAVIDFYLEPNPDYDFADAVSAYLTRQAQRTE